MSYSSRVYRQRNPKAQDESKEKPFFSKKKQEGQGQKKNAFFQAKLAVNEPGDSFEREADSVAHAVVNQGQGSSVQKKEIGGIQRLATTHEEEIDSSNDMRMERDKEKPFQRKAAAPEKEKEKMVSKKEDPAKEKDKMLHKKEDPAKEKEKMVQKKEDPIKEKEKAVQKKEDTVKEKEKMVNKKEDPMKEKDKAVQKKDAAPEKKKEKGVQKMESPKKEEDKTASSIQRKPEGSAPSATPKLSSQIENSAGRGNPLPEKTLLEMNRSFGNDFSNVRVHQDEHSASMNRELEAHAFTHGSDIYFNEGRYNPENAEGKFLLAHELTHVLQQQGPVISRDPAPAKPRFDFPVSLGFFKDFDVMYSPDDPLPQNGTIRILHNIFIVFGDKISDEKKEKFRNDFQKNVSATWQDKFLFELNDKDFTPYKANLKLDIQFVADAKDAHTIMEVKDRPKDFRSNVEGKENKDFPSLSHTAHLDTRDPSPDELAKKKAGKTFIESTADHVGNFDFDSAALNSDCETGIGDVEKHLDALPDIMSFTEVSSGNTIHYIGRASPEGNAWYNRQLSKKRAETVKERIEKDKPDAKKMDITVSGEGADKTGFESNKENYRRVNVIIVPPQEFKNQHKQDQITAAHEFGHMIGFGDEYSEKAGTKFEKRVEGDRPSHYEDVKAIMGQDAADELSMNQTASIMSEGNDIKKGHYAYFLKAIRDLTGKQGWNIK
jgi:outer membrane protein OmpA-like peptidoglycan-associated protein